VTASGMEVTETSDLADLVANAGHAFGGGFLALAEPLLAKGEAQLLDRRNCWLSDLRGLNV
jgi:hypothetical protein